MVSIASEHTIFTRPWQKWRELYEPLYPPVPTDIDVVRDEVYGPADRNRLDVYLPNDDATGKPVMMYVHGGGFFSGAKDWSEKVRGTFMAEMRQTS